MLVPRNVSRWRRALHWREGVETGTPLPETTKTFQLPCGAKNLLDDALSNMATPFSFFVFSVLFLILSKVFVLADTTTTTVRTQFFFRRQSEEALLVKQEKSSST